MTRIDERVPIPVALAALLMIIALSGRLAAQEEDLFFDDEPEANVVEGAEDELILGEVAEDAVAQPDQTDSELPLGIPPEVQAAYDRGRALVEQGDCKAAIAEFSTALSAVPTLFPATYHRAKCFAEIEAYDLAAQGFSEVLQIDRQNPDLYFQLYNTVHQIPKC